MAEQGQISFREIYEMHKHRVYNTALSFLQHREDAEDITQEVFLEVYNSIEDFRNNSSLSTWMYRITMNKCIDFKRKKSRKKRFGLFSELFHKDTGEVIIEDPAFEHPNVQFEKKEDLKILFKALNKLSDNQKMVLVLFHLEGLSQNEIALIYGSSSKAIESLVARSRKALRAEIEKFYK